ncbi:alpha-D-ribose 1-methylphosphonate 5-triphosphate diphosphatase [Marivita sp. XM-24bin2]|jgi:alpha-D-ribose 1-methylphosphonate 5-triphosphate diphosphatase|uniref:alpha-D-ribose 1-methylphosphonate 5-triphosphate diphosphatase n=1 Tax=unclassified Marivita TaxID=2632480 RepID=UPI000D7B81D0|nr:alpha-D-ribose 1-methylphosphonate 5-triphosphate diphosphatase [Marivita sp. XM-24bin2]MCR9108177.1 alpha-D-ribose 1-methylphosphonate 5-triphosphate diphosphatase [Paracoccaceae bacterium]PWL37090.1 MAG: alpha-D-ribose 1-methylphosphonate 5-triphosphate diphosphatase [Marivita sp. XM-24bin2]
MSLDCTLVRARVLTPEGWSEAPVSISQGYIQPTPAGREVDLSGYLVLPGIVDPHGDGFERHMAPRRGALREAEHGVVAAAAELAANGITTAVLAQFFSWEGGMRGPDFAEHVFESVSVVRDTIAVDMRLQLRLETHLLDEFDRAEAAIERFGISYVVFNDHLPHQRLAEGRKPPRLTGQALKSGRSPEAHLALMQDLHARSSDVPAALDQLTDRLIRKGLVLGSHDDNTLDDRRVWAKRGATVSEFPETLEAAQAARDDGGHIVLGAPNVVRGASHAGNIAASELIACGLCDALASDYHYPSPLRAAFRIEELGLCDLAKSWDLLSSGPARLLRLADRGTLETGKRADLIVVDPETRRVEATIVAGRVAHLTGVVAERFLNGW